jgi:hypothetical protein
VAVLSKSHQDLLSLLSIRTLSLLPSFYDKLSQSDNLNIDSNPIDSQISSALLPAVLSDATSSERIVVTPIAFAQSVEVVQGHDKNVQKDVTESELSHHGSSSSTNASKTDTSKTDVAHPSVVNLQQDIEHCLQQLGINQWQFTERDDITLIAETLMLPSLSHLQNAASKRILWRYLQQYFDSSCE